MAETLYDVLQFKGEAGAKSIIDEVLDVTPEVTGVDKYNGDAFPAIEQYLQYYPGLRLLSKYSVGRIANIDVSSCEESELNPKAFTDQMIYKVLMKLPAGMKPNVVFLPYGAALLLAASRTPIGIEKMPTVTRSWSADSHRLLPNLKAFPSCRPTVSKSAKRNSRSQE